MDLAAPKDTLKHRESGLPSWIRAVEEELDKPIMVVLRDGKEIRGLLRSYDQFGNLVVDRACQRFINPFMPEEYFDLYVGCMIIRGENVVLLGALNDFTEDSFIAHSLGQEFEVLDSASQMHFQSSMQHHNTTMPIRLAECSPRRVLENVEAYAAEKLRCRKLIQEHRMKLKMVAEERLVIRVEGYNSSILPTVDGKAKPEVWLTAAEIHNLIDAYAFLSEADKNSGLSDESG